MLTKLVKYFKEVLEILNAEKYISTTRVMKRLRKKTGLQVNWKTVNNTLKILHDLNKVEFIEMGKARGWRKK